MKPLIHAQLSVKKYKGHIDDYIPIHEFIDSSKAHVPDMRHRAILHSSFGCYITQEVFGVYIVNSDGRTVAVRDIAEEHILQDLGTIPTVQDYLDGLPMYEWLGGPPRMTRHIPFIPEDGETEMIEVEGTNVEVPAKALSENPEWQRLRNRPAADADMVIDRAVRPGSLQDAVGHKQYHLLEKPFRNPQANANNVLD